MSTLLWPGRGARPHISAVCEHCPRAERLTDVSTSVRHLLRTAGVPRSSEERLSHAYHLLMTQLRQEHAEVRLSAFQVVDELFARSQHFRTLVVADFQAFLELTLGTDHKQPLPPPREVARRLRQAAARAVQAWSEKFGSAYKKLALGHHFLRHSHQVGGPRRGCPGCWPGLGTSRPECCRRWASRSSRNGSQRRRKSSAQARRVERGTCAPGFPRKMKGRRVRLGL